MTRILGRNFALSLAAAALLAGCGSRSAGDASGQATAKPVTRKTESAVEELSRNMVSAVAANKPSTLPIQVKFELRERPDVGQPVDIDLAIVTMSASVDRVSGKVEGEEGLELLEGAQIAATDRPTEGMPIRHSIKVLPKQQGLFTVHALMSVDAGGQTSTDTYTIPLIAGGEVPDLPAKPAAGAAAAAIAAAAAPRGGDSARPAAPAGTAAAQ
jgi:hypothetical protein